MSVTELGGASLELYPGGNMDPRIPAGKWFAGLSVSGDATGGVVNMQVEFFPASSPPNSFYFTLESIGVERNDGQPDEPRLNIGGFTLGFGGAQLVGRSWALELAEPGSVGSNMLGRDAGVVPLNLGYRVDAAQAVLNLGFKDNVNGTTFRFYASGEFWLQEAGFYIGAQQPIGSTAFESSRPAEAQGSMVDIRAGRPPLQVPAVDTPGLVAAKPFPVVSLGPDIVVGAVGATTKSKPIKVSPVAAQDPYAALRAAYVQSLATMGKRVATIPGNSVDEINGNFFSLRTSVLNTARTVLTGIGEVVPPTSIAPPPKRSTKTTRSGGQSSAVNPKVAGPAIPAPVKTFAAQRFAIRRLNISALRSSVGRPRTTNPTGGNSTRGSSTRRDVFENEG